LDFNKEIPDDKEINLVKGILPPNERRMMGLTDELYSFDLPKN
jgi:hypothetical protein